MRGMSMREMKARQLGRAPRVSPEREQHAFPLVTDDEPEDLDGVSLLADEGDGVLVRYRARPECESERHEDCPDEAPPGWCDVT